MIKIKLFCHFLIVFKDILMMNDSPEIHNLNVFSSTRLYCIEKYDHEYWTYGTHMVLLAILSLVYSKTKYN